MLCDLAGVLVLTRGKDYKVLDQAHIGLTRKGIVYELFFTTLPHRSEGTFGKEGRFKRIGDSSNHRLPGNPGAEKPLAPPCSGMVLWT